VLKNISVKKYKTKTVLKNFSVKKVLIICVKKFKKIVLKNRKNLC